MNNLQLWNNILNKLKIKYDSITVDNYFSDSILEKIDHGEKTFTVSVLDDFVSGSIMTTFKDDIEKYFNNEIKNSNYVLNHVEIRKTNTEIPNVDRFMKDSIFSGDNLKSNFNFENYYETKSNKYALAQAKSIVENFNNNQFTYFPMFIHGDSGVGKTHLVNAVGNEIKNRYPSTNIKYLTSNEYLNIYVDAVNNSQNEIKKMSDFFNNLDLLIIEDFQFFSNKIKTEEQFYYTFEALQSKGAKLIITSDVHPQSLLGIEKRLLTRLESGIFVEIDNPDYESRYILIKKKMEEYKNVSFESGIAELLAQIENSNVRSLEGWLKTLVARSLTEIKTESSDSNISFSFAAKILKVGKKKISQQTLTTKKIITTTSKFYNLSEKEILSTRRSKDIALARNVAIYLCRNLLNLTYKDIAHVFGKKDHTTIISSIKRIESLKKTTQVEMDLREIKSELA